MVCNVPGLTPGASFFSPLRGSRSGLSQSFLSTAASVEAPYLPGIGDEKNYEQKKQREVVEFGAEVAPHGDSLPRLPPGGESEAEHVHSAQHRRWPYPDSQQQARSNKHFDGSDQISEENSVRQHEVGQDRLIKTDSAALNEALEILLEPAMGKLGAENLVLAEKQKEGGRSDPDDGNGFGQGTGYFAHRSLYFTRT